VTHCLCPIENRRKYVFICREGDRTKKITEWQPWTYSEREILKAERRGKKLRKIEIGRFYWQPSWAESLRILVIVKRTWKEPENPQRPKQITEIARNATENAFDKKYLSQ
jgi:hypothetical protein